MIGNVRWQDQLQTSNDDKANISVCSRVCTYPGWQDDMVYCALWVDKDDNYNAIIRV